MPCLQLALEIVIDVLRAAGDRCDKNEKQGRNEYNVCDYCSGPD